MIIHRPWSVGGHGQPPADRKEHPMDKITVTVTVNINDLSAFTRQYGDEYTLNDVRDTLTDNVYTMLTTGVFGAATRRVNGNGNDVEVMSCIGPSRALIGHRRDNGLWCRWSHSKVARKVTACPEGCTGGAVIEVTA